MPLLAIVPPATDNCRIRMQRWIHMLALLMLGGCFAPVPSFYLQVNVALICAGELGVFHFAAGDRSGEIRPGRHLSRQEGSAPKD